MLIVWVAPGVGGGVKDAKIFDCYPAGSILLWEHRSFTACPDADEIVMDLNEYRRLIDVEPRWDRDRS